MKLKASRIFSMKQTQFLSKSQEETIKLGERLAHSLQSGDIIGLFGDLGSGKTTFTKGIARGLKIKEEDVNSPTFTLMNVYEGRLSLFHFDLYRLDQIKEILNLGYEEFLYGEGVSVIEWAEKMGRLLPQNFLKVHLSSQDENQRLITFCAVGKRSQGILKNLKL